MTDPRVTDVAAEAGEVALDRCDWSGASSDEIVRAVLTAALQHLVADTIAKARREGEADMRERCMLVCGTLAETTYDDSDGFEAATGCEAAIRALPLSGDDPK